MRFAWLIICALLCGCATESWTREDTRREVIFQVLNVADAMTTANIHKTAGIVEKNPLTRSLIGEQPASADVAILFAVYGVGHILISRSLTPKWRKRFQIASNLAAGYVVFNNCKLDLC